MKIKKIEIDKNLCIGCGSCVVIAQEAFEPKDAKSCVKKDWQKESQENIISAQRACPVGAINLYDKDDKKVD